MGTGKTYLIDHNTRTTTERDPRSLTSSALPQYKLDYRGEFASFRSEQAMRGVPGKFEIRFMSAMALEDSFSAVMKRHPEHMRKRIAIGFDKAEGVDAHSLSSLRSHQLSQLLFYTVWLREWFSFLSRRIFNPSYGIFTPFASDSRTFQINSSPRIDPDHLTHFEFAGRIVGMAIFHRRSLNVFFGGKKSLLPASRVSTTLSRGLTWVLCVGFYFYDSYLLIIG